MHLRVMLVERGIKKLPEDFLEYHRDTQSPYHGSRGPIVEAEHSLTSPNLLLSLENGLQTGNGAELQGRVLKVNEARPQESGGGGGSRGGRGGGGGGYRGGGGGRRY